jgi:hypothetical protein
LRTATLFCDLEWNYDRNKKYKINKMAFPITLDTIFFGGAMHIDLININNKKHVSNKNQSLSIKTTNHEKIT